MGSRSRGFVAAATVTGLLLGAAVGIGLIWFGISFNLNASTCDPESSRCVTVIDGVARGESTESVGSQQFGNLLLSLVAILPGAVILVGVTRGMVSLVRKGRGRPGAPGPDPV
ncbi:hypothetical protein [Micromonospora schwarzwaldensis]|uniref:hypothetical protein n=1 Tax=Micromonospora sp. DSM 45708 TaxID=3111767 RepID=UPI0031D757D3